MVNKLTKIILVGLAFSFTSILSMQEKSEAILVICKQGDRERAEPTINNLRQLGFNITVIDKVKNIAQAEILNVTQANTVASSSNQKLENANINQSQKSMINNLHNSQAIKRDKIVLIGNNLEDLEATNLKNYFCEFSTVKLFQGAKYFYREELEKYISENGYDQTFIPIIVEIISDRHRHPSYYKDCTSLTILLCSASIGSPYDINNPNIFAGIRLPGYVKVDKFDAIVALKQRIKELYG